MAQPLWKTIWQLKMLNVVTIWSSNSTRMYICPQIENKFIKNKTVQKSLNNIVSLSVISPLIRKKSIPTRASVCVVHLVSPCSVWACSGFSGFHPNAHVGWTCVGRISVSNLSQAECVYNLQWKGILCRAAPTLSCWDRLQPPDALNWIKCAGNNYLTCFY